MRHDSDGSMCYGEHTRCDHPSHSAPRTPMRKITVTFPREWSDERIRRALRALLAGNWSADGAAIAQSMLRATEGPEQ